MNIFSVLKEARTKSDTVVMEKARPTLPAVVQTNWGYADLLKTNPVNIALRKGAKYDSTSVQSEEYKSLFG